MLPPENANVDPTPKPRGPNGKLTSVSKAELTPHMGELLAEPALARNFGADMPHGTGGSQMDPIGLLRALRRRWQLATGLGIVCALAAGFGMWAIYHYVLAPKFTAYALLAVSAGPRKILFPTAESDTGTYSSLTTHAILIRSPFVLSAALRRPGVAQLDTVREQADPVGWLEKNVQVSFPAQSEVLRIALSGENPSDLPVIVNAVKEAYVEEIGDTEQKRRTQRLTDLQRILTEHEGQIKSKKTMLKEMASGLGSGDPKALSSKQQFGIQMHAQLQAELLRTQAELNKARVRAVAERELGEPEEPPKAEISDSLIDRHVDNHPDVRQLLRERMQQQQKVDDKAMKLKRKDDPSLVSDQKKLDALDESLSELRQKLHPAIKADLAEQTRNASLAAGGNTQREIVLLTEQVKAYQEQWDLQSEKVDSLGRSSLEIEHLKSDIDKVDQLTSIIAGEIGKLMVELQAPPRIAELQKAEVPKVEDTGSRNNKIGMAAFAGFCLGLFIVSFWEYRSHRVESANEVEFSLGLRIMGSLPDLPTRALSGPNGSTKSYWLSLLSESIDGIRTTLLFDADKRSIRTIMVTSALGHEGKTTLATHLATSLARAGRRTLLVDCDLRRPAVHLLFDLPLQPGFVEVTKGTEDVHQAIRPTHVPDLWLLPAGQLQRGTVEGLTNGIARTLFDQLKEEYDFVVIDSAPVLPVADSLIIGQHVDGVILSVLRGVSQMHRVWAAQSRLSMLGVHILGAVVNRVRGDVYGYGNYYHYKPEGEIQPSLGTNS